MAAFKKHFSAKVGVIAFLAIFISSAGLVLAAWQAPQSAPPEGNPAPPLDTGNEAQTKAGNLSVGSENQNVTLTNSSIQFLNGTQARIYLANGDLRVAIGNQTFSLAQAAPVWFRNNNNQIYYNSGNVGVGTDNPAEKLVLAGGGNFLLRGEGDAGDVIFQKYQMIRGVDEPVEGEGVQEGRIWTDSRYDGSLFFSSTDNDPDITINSSGAVLTRNLFANNMSVAGDFIASTTQVRSTTTLATVSGNVGIGTNNPVGKLDVNGSVFLRANISVATTAGGAQMHVWGADGGGGNNVLRLSRQGTAQSVTFQIYPRQQNGDEVFYLNAGTRGFLSFKNGNIGVATVTPTSTLTVAGTISASNGLVIGNDYLNGGYSAPANGAIFEGKVNVGTKEVDSAGLLRVEGGDLVIDHFWMANNDNVLRWEWQGDYLRNDNVGNINACSGLFIVYDDDLRETMRFNIDADNNDARDLNPNMLYGGNNLREGSKCVDNFVQSNVQKKAVFEVKNKQAGGFFSRNGSLVFADSRQNVDLQAGFSAYKMANEFGQLKISADRAVGSDNSVFSINKGSEGNNIIHYNLKANGENLAPLRMYYIPQEADRLISGEDGGGYYSYAVYAP